MSISEGDETGNAWRSKNQRKPGVKGDARMAYSEEIIEQVRSSNDIVDVVSTYVQLKRRGSNFVGLCPFHNEKTGSFSVNANMQIFKCFGCGVGGNVFTFIEKIENLSFYESVEFLADRANGCFHWKGGFDILPDISEVKYHSEASELILCTF